MSNQVQLISIATNDYLSLWRAQVQDSAEAIRQLDWKLVLLTDNVGEAKKVAEQAGLSDRAQIKPILPFKFPMASMVRYLAIVESCEDRGWICYLDADMKIENPWQLDFAIRSSNEATVVSHPGYTRPRGSGRGLGLKHLVSNLLLHLREGGLGAWETRRNSTAFVPRSRRKSYAQAAIFFGPASKIRALSSTCWAWTETDLQRGIIPRWHDESYLNRWMAENYHILAGPEFCYFDFPWLNVKRPVVRAVDKSSLKVP